MSHITPSLRTQSLMSVPPSSDKGKEEDVSISVSFETEPVEGAPIDTLPIEILTMIFWLATNNGKDQNALCRMRGVSRLWHQLIEGSAEDEHLYHYGLLSSYWSKFKGEIQHPFLKETISLIDRSVSWIITLPDDDSYGEESVLFLDSTHFSHFQDLSRELTGTSRLLGFSAAPYEEMQRALDTSLKQIWPLIQAKINFTGAPIPDNAQAIREWLSNPANAEKIACITWLDLTYRNLKVLPPEIGHFSQVKTLNLDFNQLSSLPLALNNLSILKTLTLRTNSFSFFPQMLYLGRNEFASLPESIGNLSQLIELHLGDNQLTSLPESIGNLSQLTTLSLGVNQLRSLPESIGNLSQLTHIRLLFNRLESLPQSIGNLSQLKMLDLSHNQLTSLPESIGNLFQLTTLSLDENRLTSLPQSIDNLSHLRSLFLHRNQLRSLPESISNLSELRLLSLNENRLTSLPESIGNLYQLAMLHPYHNPLLFILKRRFFESDSDQSLPHRVMTHQHIACSNYVCQMPLASLCQEIHRGKEDEVLRSAFAKLPDELQQQIRAWAADLSSSDSSSEAAPDLFADRASLTRAIITVLQNRWRFLSEDQRRQIYAQVAILAGQPQPDANWGEAHAEENIIRLIDAMEYVTQK